MNEFDPALKAEMNARSPVNKARTARTAKQLKRKQATRELLHDNITSSGPRDDSGHHGRSHHSVSPIISPADNQGVRGPSGAEAPVDGAAVLQADSGPGEGSY